MKWFVLIVIEYAPIIEELIPRGLLASHADFESAPRRFDSYLGSIDKSFNEILEF